MKGGRLTEIPTCMSIVSGNTMKYSQCTGAYPLANAQGNDDIDRKEISYHRFKRSLPNLNSKITRFWSL